MKIIVPISDEETEVTILEWFKKDGDSVIINEDICEIETDKASQTLVSPKDGILKIYVPQGEAVPAGSVIGVVESE